jgi:hypothetical protein
MLHASDFDQSSNGVLEYWSLSTIYDDTDGKGDEEYDECRRLVPAQTDWHCRAYASFDVGICYQMDDQRNGKQCQA